MENLKNLKVIIRFLVTTNGALTQVFETLNYETVIIVEDDLDIAPDFFEYFRATYPILKSDPTLWCVSAWNDNGKQGLIQTSAGNLKLLIHHFDLLILF